ncbi:MAG: 1-acyl-sn-glycerol-3-phosphate acyltransferase [Agarilytica sp.]
MTTPSSFILPEKVPSTGNALTRWLGRTILRSIGWQVKGELPNHAQVVICGAPHTSNWDFIVAMGVSLAMGIKFSYLMKKEAFIWPFRGLFMAMGGIPLDRGSSVDTVQQIAQWYRDHDQVWLAITPEGTRSKVERWKTGFLRIAHQAQVPVFLVGWHYPEKALYLDKLWHTTGDHVKDAEEIRAYLTSRYQGAHPEKQ